MTTRAFNLAELQVDGSGKLTVDSNNIEVGTASKNGDSEVIMTTSTARWSIFSDYGTDVLGIYKYGTNSGRALTINSNKHIGLNIGNTGVPRTYLDVRTDAIAAGTDLQEVGIAVSTPFVSGYQTQNAALIGGYDGQDNAIFSTAIGQVYTNPGYGLSFFTNSTTSGQPTERLRISEDGYVGIGSTTPTQPVDIRFNNADGNKNGLNITNTSSNASGSYSGIVMKAENGTVTGDIFAVPTSGSVSAGGALALRTQTNHPIVFKPNSSTRLKILADGRLNHGNATTNPNAAITIGGNWKTSYGTTMYLNNQGSAGGDGFILTTDSTWTTHTNAGQAGLALGVGAPSSSNMKIHIREDGVVTIGKNVYSYVGSSGDSGTELHVTGPISFGQGNNSEWSNAGRRVLGWHSVSYSNGGSSYAHVETDLWGGSGSNSDYIMGGFEVRGYRYASPGHSFEMIGFHNWSGGLAAYNVASMGNWTAGCSAYVGSNGYVYLRLPNASYYGFIIDLYQYAWYPKRNIRVVQTTFSSTANL